MALQKTKKREVKYARLHRYAKHCGRVSQGERGARGEMRLRLDWKKIILRSAYWLSLFAFFGAAGYVLFFSPLLMIKEISVSGTMRVSAQKVQERVAENLAGKSLGVFLKSNIIIVNKSAISDDVKNLSLLIRDVDVSKKFPNQIIVSVIEREPSLVFCGSDCQVIDEEGAAFARADFEAGTFGEKELPVLRDQSGKVVEMGKEVLNVDYLKYFLNAKKQVEEISGTSVQGEASTPRLASGDIRLPLSEGWTVLLDQGVSIEKETEMLRLVLETNIPKEKRLDLEYIDLRIENKVYYKFKNAEQIQAPIEGQDQSTVDPPKDEADKKDKKKKK